MTDSQFTETTISSRLVFDGKLLKVRSDAVRLPDGSESFREWVAHPGAVVIIAQLDNGRLLFERQYRYPLRRVMLELPAGKIEKSEAELATAQRELIEETGYQASGWHHLGALHTCIGYSDERIEIYLARGLVHVGAQPDAGEILELLDLSLEEALEAVRTGRITDGKTVAALLWAEKAIQGHWPLL